MALELVRNVGVPHFTKILGEGILGLRFCKNEGYSRKSILCMLARDAGLQSALQAVFETISGIAPSEENVYEDTILGDFAYAVRNFRTMDQTKKGAILNFVNSLMAHKLIKNSPSFSKISMQLQNKLGLGKQNVKFKEPKMGRGAETTIGQGSAYVPSDTWTRREIQKQGNAEPASNLSLEQAKGELVPKDVHPDALSVNQSLPIVTSIQDSMNDLSTFKTPATKQVSVQVPIPEMKGPGQKTLDNQKEKEQPITGKRKLLEFNRDSLSDQMVKAAKTLSRDFGVGVNEAPQTQSLNPLAYPSMGQGTGQLTTMGGQPGVSVSDQKNSVTHSTTKGDGKGEDNQPSQNTVTEMVDKGLLGNALSAVSNYLSKNRAETEKLYKENPNMYKGIPDVAFSAGFSPGYSVASMFANAVPQSALEVLDWSHYGKTPVGPGPSGTNNQGPPVWGDTPEGQGLGGNNIAALNNLNQGPSGTNNQGPPGGTPEGQGLGENNVNALNNDQARTMPGPSQTNNQGVPLTNRHGRRLLGVGGSQGISLVDKGSQQAGWKTNKAWQALDRIKKTDPDWQTFLNTESVLSFKNKEHRQVMLRIFKDAPGSFMRFIANNESTAYKNNSERMVKKAKTLITDKYDYKIPEIYFTEYKPSQTTSVTTPQTTPAATPATTTTPAATLDPNFTPQHGKAGNAGKSGFMMTSQEARGLMDYIADYDPGWERYEESGNLDWLTEENKNSLLALGKYAPGEYLEWMKQNVPSFIGENDRSRSYLEKIQKATPPEYQHDIDLYKLAYSRNKKPPKVSGSTTGIDPGQSYDPNRRSSRDIWEVMSYTQAYDLGFGKFKETGDMKYLLPKNRIELKEILDQNEDPQYIADYFTGIGLDRHNIIDTTSQEQRAQQQPPQSQQAQPYNPISSQAQPYSAKPLKNETTTLVDVPQKEAKVENTGSHGIPLLRAMFEEGNADVINQINNDQKLELINRLTWQTFNCGQWEANDEADNPLHMIGITEDVFRFSGELDKDEVLQDQSSDALKEEFNTKTHVAFDIPNNVQLQGQCIVQDILPETLGPTTSKDTDAIFHDVYLPPWIEIPPESPWNLFTTTLGTQIPDSQLDNPELVTGNDWPLLASKNSFITTTLA